MSLLDRALRVAGTVARDLLRPRRTSRRGSGDAVRRNSGARPRPEPGSGGGAGQRTEHPHTTREFEVGRGLPPLRYSPSDDGAADPGEVVWAWVPYDENDGRGKDRPVLILTRHNQGFLGLQLTSKDHDRDAEDEARWGRRWLDIGSGGWDSRGRPSEVRLDRVLFLPADAVRREGAAVDRRTYDRVSDALHDLHGH
ncbi:type II toxin-antitoxin system PemK/MazF family toxin [Occultella glacieicola]|uniref:Type II toxin-antitoxin system PemK/MazF family toxin n=1 Tax=Occultella glacieicola TaxID=2518684 RepID=A0ABY2DZ18_9MICO|nr:type II toxin-antitoxin system PemK/MazF family toxin [Occultella glacieicola]TDE89928.1 type II toxin-antitoxin system PemK/MazF family toxin [Occultella glacieicola]